ncbi:MAG: hypothetical protein KKA68_21035, partial [Gammaproteobacteria bacterium]|nr:hypothetical protein [Gammaproteobacteria bacterium]
MQRWRGSHSFDKIILRDSAALAFGSGDITLTHSANTLTFAGGDLAFSGESNTHFLNFDGATLSHTLIGVA